MGFEAKVGMRRRKHRKLPDTIAKRAGVKVGLPRGVDSGVLEYAVYNHFGTRHIPARPFLSLAMRQNKAKYRRLMHKAGKSILLGEMQTSTALGRLGVLAQGDVTRMIETLRSPANAPETIAKKGSSNPLIDTGRMRSAITWAVED